MPKQPWEFDLAKREADAKPLFIIFCEDEVSEPLYFESFRTENIKINAIGGQKQGMQNVFNALEYCEKKGLLEGQGDEEKLIKSHINIWCAFDRDKGAISPVDFEEAIRTAERRGFGVAWSNDNFELWILLHFEGVDPNLPKNKDRKTYYKRLTEFFKNLPEQNEFLSQKTSNPKFDYKNSFKSKNNFIQFVLPFLKEQKHRDLALQRAKTLKAYHATPNKPNHQKSPCTMVHYLVEKLLEIGGKEV